MWEVAAPYIWGALMALVVVFITDRLQPLVRSAKNASFTYGLLSRSLNKLGAGTLLHVTDQRIMELGEAAVLSGMSTVEANSLMLAAIKEQKLAELRDPKLGTGSNMYLHLPGRHLPVADD